MEYYWIYYIFGIILIPGLIWGSVASVKVNKTFSKYSKVFSNKNIPANVMARKILDASGLQNVKVVKVNGRLTDHYNPKEKILALSEEVYNSASLSALGVAAHELGHALQDKDKYAPMKIRSIFAGFSKFGSSLLIPLIVVGVILLFVPITENFISILLIGIGVGLYGFSIIFNLITLPVELNASKRTEEILISSGLLEDDEYQDVKKVLNAAAQTYVASLVISILYLLRFVLWALTITNKKD